MNDTDTIKAALRKRPKKEEKHLWLSTGSTLLNLACTGRPFRGLRSGGYYLVIGASSAGKTVLGGTCLAEAAINPKFKDYDLIFDNAEDGALMFNKFFGERIGKRIRPPNPSNKEQPNSRTIEDFYYNHHTNTKKGANVTVLDSENALTSEAEKKKQAQKRKSIEEETEVAGTMTDAKAKYHSQNLRGAVADVQDSQSILVFLAQSRDNMGFGAMFEKETRSGGRALKFYAQLEMWFSIVKHLTKKVRGRDREIGIIARVKVKKNRFTGKNRTVDIPIYHSFGIDDLGSCINYLILEQHWKRTQGTINAPEFDFKGSRDDLIHHIEEKNLEHDLRSLVGEVWQSIEEACEVKRKPRYI